MPGHLDEDEDVVLVEAHRHDLERRARGEAEIASIVRRDREERRVEPVRDLHVGQAEQLFLTGRLDEGRASNG